MKVRLCAQTSGVLHCECFLPFCLVFSVSGTMAVWEGTSHFHTLKSELPDSWEILQPDGDLIVSEAEKQSGITDVRERKALHITWMLFTKCS